MEEERLTVTKFAELIGMNFRTLYRYIKKGAITPRIEQTPTYYFLASDIEAVRAELERMDSYE